MLLSLVGSLLPPPSLRWQPACNGRRSGRLAAAASAATEAYDVVVIGSGIGGLSAAAAMASTGLSVAVCESLWYLKTFCTA